jgi:hypothetical protein
MRGLACIVSHDGTVGSGFWEGGLRIWRPTL